MDSRFRGNDVISGEPRSLSRTRLRAPDGRDARATGSLSPPHGRDARATAGETPALQIHHLMDGRFDLDFGKQVGKQLAAGAARKIRGWRIPIQIIGTCTCRRLQSGCVCPLRTRRAQTWQRTARLRQPR